VYSICMCAIAGSTNRHDVEEMLAIMAHRGPDDCGVVELEGYVLGMARLKILDLDSPGLCPVVVPGATLAFNGELYNYIELRYELEKLGEKFYTDGDSEVLLKAYQRWGPPVVGKLNFMGAFAIAEGDKIFLARDIAGEKPLYYRRPDRP